MYKVLDKEIERNKKKREERGCVDTYDLLSKDMCLDWGS